MKTKKMTLTVYEFKPLSNNVNEENPGKDIYEALNKSKSAKDRLMPLNSQDENSDSDFIPGFQITSGFLFCSFSRLNHNVETIISKALLENKIIDLNEVIVKTEDGNEGTVQDSVFFCLYKNLMIMNSSRNHIKQLEIYLNWLFEKNDIKNKEIRFVPKQRKDTEIPIEKVRSVSIGESYLSSKKEYEKKILDVKKSVLNTFFSDTPTLTDDWENNILSATLVIKFNKTRLRKDGALDTAFKLVDSDDIIVSGNNGKRIKGTEYIVSAQRNIQILTSGHIDEKALESEMRSILKGVEKNEVVN